jgi:hypothetical protein
MQEHLITRAEQADLPGINRFVNSVTSNLDAVTAGLSLPFSSGPVEGNVNRIKTLNRASTVQGRSGPQSCADMTQTAQRADDGRGGVLGRYSYAAWDGADVHDLVAGTGNGFAAILPVVVAATEDRAEQVPPHDDDLEQVGWVKVVDRIQHRVGHGGALALPATGIGDDSSH